jgi:hypothetical protein
MLKEPVGTMGGSAVGACTTNFFPDGAWRRTTMTSPVAIEAENPLLV